MGNGLPGSVIGREKKKGIVNLKNSVVELSPIAPHFTDDLSENTR
jgi:hypothetical protein